MNKAVLIIGVLSAAVVGAVVLLRGQNAPVVPQETQTKRPRSDSKGTAHEDRTSPVDLLSTLVPERDAIRGEWKKDQETLVTPEVEFARIKLTGAAPSEYDLVLLVRRMAGKDSLNLGLVGNGRQFVVMIDGWDQGDSSGIDLIEARPFFLNETTFRGQLLTPGVAHKIRCSVRGDGVKLRVDDKLVINWKGSFEKLGVYKEWEIGNSSALFLGSYKSQFRIESILLEGQ